MNIPFHIFTSVTLIGTSSRDREHFREIQVKVHVRRPEKDTWVYLGRGTVSQEVNGHSSRVGSYLIWNLLSIPSLFDFLDTDIYCHLF
jgi:hypothetical protein